MVLKIITLLVMFTFTVLIIPICGNLSAKTTAEEVVRLTAIEIEMPDSDSKDWVFANPKTIKVHEQEVFVADTGKGHIEVFSCQGKHLRTIGRRGQGPGEINSMRDFSIKGAKLYVLEANRLSVFTLEGVFIESTKLPFSASGLHLAADNLIVFSLLAPGRASGSVPLLVGSDGSAREVWRALPSLYSGDMTLDTMQNLLVLMGTGEGVTLVLRKSHDRNLYHFDEQGRKISQIEISALLPFKTAVFRMSGKKIEIPTLCHHAFVFADQVYLLLNELVQDKQVIDTRPGKEIAVIDQKGELKKIIDLPFALRAVAYDGKNFFGIERDEHSLKKLVLSGHE